MLNVNIPVYVDWYMSRPTAAKNSIDKFYYFTQEGFKVGMIYLTKTEIELMGKKYSQTLSVKEAFDDLKNICSKVWILSV